jgi:hypothetical protein
MLNFNVLKNMPHRIKTENRKNQKETGIPESVKRLNEDMPGNTF